MPLDVALPQKIFKCRLDSFGILIEVEAEMDQVSHKFQQICIPIA